MRAPYHSAMPPFFDGSDGRFARYIDGVHSANCGDVSLSTVKETVADVDLAPVNFEVKVVEYVLSINSDGCAELMDSRLAAAKRSAIVRLRSSMDSTVRLCSGRGLKGRVL